MKIKLDKGSFMPTRAHQLDAGLDLYSPINTVVPNCELKTNIYQYDVRVGSVTIDTGVHIQIPEGYVGLIKSKSGLNVKHGLTCDGVIDAGYTGSIKVKLYNHTNYPIYLMQGDKIAQIVILPILTPELEQVDELEQTERGNNVFGSTGR